MKSYTIKMNISDYERAWEELKDTIKEIQDYWKPLVLHPKDETLRLKGIAVLEELSNFQDIINRYER